MPAGEPGVSWLKHYLTLDEQQALTARCIEILDGPAGGYVPTVRGGGKMRVRMVCLGRHWNPLTYRYEATRARRIPRPTASARDRRRLRFWARFA